MIENGYRLGVHIADVSHYVTSGSELDKEAYRRGTSIYVVDRVVPMLPHALSNGICSLNPRVVRLTLSCIMDIDYEGNIIDYKLCPSFIKSHYRMTYKNVNKILSREEKMTQKYENLVEMLDIALELSDVLANRKRRLGAINFDSRESEIKVDEKGKVIDVKVRERGRAEQIIEDFMVAANECVASINKNMDLVSIYRVHETPDVKKMREFISTAKTMGYQFKGDINDVHPKQLQKMLKDAQGQENFGVLSTYMLRSMRKARYDRQCLGHFGLALKEYTHFTSPIRRYPDLIVHRMLRKYYFNQCIDLEQIKKDDEFVEEASVQTSKCERVAVETERDIEDMKKCEYMESFIGRKYDGIISGVTKFGFFVELDNAIEGLVHVSTMQDDHYNYDDRIKALIGEHTAKVFKMGQKVRVELIEASKFKKQIEFQLIEVK